MSAHHVLPRTWQKYSFVEKEHPVLRIMVSQSTSHWDCIFKNVSEFQDWLSGISLAYGMQTVPILNKRNGGSNNEIEDMDDDDGMSTM